MPLDFRHRVHTPFAPNLDLPPPFRAVTLREVGDAFAHAKKIAADSGAGTLVQVGRFDLAEFAIVLEPDEPLRTARRALYAGLIALVDALASQAPPEKPINIDWPATIRIDGGLVGGAQLAWPTGVREDAKPPWLVFGAMIRAVSMDPGEPGLDAPATALDTEGFRGGSDGLIESFARHLMVAIDAWQQDGFANVARTYLSRLAREKGNRHDLDDNGDLLVRHVDKTVVERHVLKSALATVSWLDPATGGPRL